MNRKQGISSVALLLSFGVGLAAQMEAPKKESEPKRVQVSQEARVALAAAKDTITLLKGVRGEERKAGLSKAAMAYGAVAEKFADEPAAVSAALFESGEAWRRHGSLDKAENAYRRVMVDGGPRYLGRATFQVAQMERRLERLEDAIATYERAQEIEPMQNRANLARLWIARCHMKLGKAEEGMQAFSKAVAAAASPRQVIEASNYLVKALVDAGDLAAASAALAKAEQDVAKVIAAGGKGSEGLQAALDRMSARKALQAAMDKANGAAQDAANLERDRRRKTA